MLHLFDDVVVPAITAVCRERGKERRNLSRVERRLRLMVSIESVQGPCRKCSTRSTGPVQDSKKKRHNVSVRSIPKLQWKDHTIACSLLTCLDFENDSSLVAEAVLSRRLHCSFISLRNAGIGRHQSQSSNGS